MHEKFRLIAFYLPQFHPIPENNAWWGNGFTEWTNVVKAKPLFPGHHQPNLPRDLGFYDLRVPEIRQAQAELAEQSGLEGFCYWHYWFGNRKVLLERPMREMISAGAPRLPFCVAWANESWTGKWHGLDSKVLQEQTYPGLDDAKKHFYYLLNAFADDRYIRVENKPLLVIYRPYQIPNASAYLEIFRNLAEAEGLGGLYILGFTDTRLYDYTDYLLDGLIYSGFSLAINEACNGIGNLGSLLRRIRMIAKGNINVPRNVYTYQTASQAWMKYPDFDFEYYPVVFPNWDNSPRCGKDSIIITNSTPALWKNHLMSAFRRVRTRKYEKRIVFIKSWNEWAEGNYIEPDQRYGKAYLDVIRRTLNELN